MSRRLVGNANREIRYPSTCLRKRACRGGKGITMSRKNTTAVNKRIVFVKDDAGWYADMEGTRQQDALVAGADKLAEAMADGKMPVPL